MSHDKPARYMEDGVTYYRASALGLCDRIFIALANYYDPQAHPQWFQEVLDEGTRSEQAIINQWETETGGWVRDQQREVKLWITDELCVVGHLDGTFWTPDDVIDSPPFTIFDAKKFRDSTWMKFLRNGVECQPTYPWQMSVYMHAINQEYEVTDTQALMVGGRYSEKGTIEEVHPHYIPMVPIPLKAISKRVLMLESRIGSGVQPIDQPCTSKVYPCPFFYLHDPEDQESPPELPADDEVAPLLARRSELSEAAKVLNKQAKDAEAEAKELNKQIEQWLRQRNLDDGEKASIKVGDTEYDVKYLTVYRKGYEVQPTEYVKVTVDIAKAKHRKPVPRNKGKDT